MSFTNKLKWRDVKKMRKILDFKSIRSKMLFGFSVVLILVALLGTYNVSMNRTTNQAANSMANEELPVLIASEGLVTTLSDRINMAYSYLLFGDPIYKERFESYTELGIQFEEEIREVHSSPEFDNLMNRVGEWREFVQKEIFPEIELGNGELALERLEASSEDLYKILEEHKDLAADSAASIIEIEEQITSNSNNLIYIGSVVSLLVIFLGLGIAILTSNMIARPINIVMERMNLIAAGDLSSESLEVRTNDEVGQLVASTNTMNKNMRSLIRNIHSVAETVSSQSEELSQSTIEVTAGTEQVSHTMQELAVAAESQANHSTTLSTSMSSYTNEVREANDSGQHIEQSTNDVLSMTNKGAELMNQSTKQMDEIDRIVLDAVSKVEGLDQSSQEISQLVGIIQDIAEQTNLLALNAAIEAARAGEEGQGFAVVAEEVRKLAEQVSVSVTDITQIVENIHEESKLVTESLHAGYKEVENGSKQIGLTGQTFNEISQIIIEMTDNAQDISGRLTAIVKSSEQMNNSIEEVAAISEEAAAGIQEVSASSEQTSSTMTEVATSSNELSILAEDLNQLVSEFKI